MTRRQIEVQKIIKDHMLQMEREIENETGATFSEYIRELKVMIEKRCDAHVTQKKFFTK